MALRHLLDMQILVVWIEQVRQTSRLALVELRGCGWLSVDRWRDSLAERPLHSAAFQSQAISNQNIAAIVVFHEDLICITVVVVAAAGDSRARLTPRRRRSHHARPVVIIHRHVLLLSILLLQVLRRHRVGHTVVVVCRCLQHHRIVAVVF